VNRTGGVTVSLHIYGMHINHTRRSQFDVDSSTAKPYISKIENGSGELR
jgi:hypothetical protein